MLAPRLRQGFAGQDMYVIPRPILAEARRHPLVRPLYPTDIGWYPQARYHYRERPGGAAQDHLMMCVDAMAMWKSTVVSIISRPVDY